MILASPSERSNGTVRLIDAKQRAGGRSQMAGTTRVDGIEMTLTPAVKTDVEWVDYNDYVRQLRAAWVRLDPREIPLNPRIVGAPGLGKTTLACATAQAMGQELYIFQCTMDTRPEDLIVTPVLGDEQKIQYRASAIVTAMLRGGIALLDEGNRMPERSWASLAPLMDDRRYVESAVTGVRFEAHPDFHLAITMNSDSSVYELPGYIQSRLKPKIEVVNPPWEIQERIVRSKSPHIDETLLTIALQELRERAQRGVLDSTRDMLVLIQYAQKLLADGLAEPLQHAIAAVLSSEPAAIE
jgi:MoxR-like ATPase